MKKKIEINVYSNFRKKKQFHCKFTSIFCFLFSLFYRYSVLNKM